MTATLTKLLDRVFDLRYFHPDEEIKDQIAIPFLWDKGTGPLVLVQGENAGGKSFFRRLVQAVARLEFKTEIHEVIPLSMEARAGQSGMYGPARALVYGDESYNATGVLTSQIVTGGIKTAQSRDNSTLLYWDEPDIGMSASSAAGVGVSIRDFIDNLSVQTQAVFVTSHNPALMYQILQAKDKPHYVYLGNSDGPPTAKDWLRINSDPALVVPRNLEELSMDGHRRFKLIQALLPKERT